MRRRGEFLRTQSPPVYLRNKANLIEQTVYDASKGSKWSYIPRHKTAIWEIRWVKTLAVFWKTDRFISILDWESWVCRSDFLMMKIFKSRFIWDRDKLYYDSILWTCITETKTAVAKNPFAWEQVHTLTLRSENFGNITETSGEVWSENTKNHATYSEKKREMN